MSEIRGSNFTIINKDGKVIAKGDEVQVRHAGSVFLPTNAIPDLERHDWKAEATCTMKLSKRKGRKFRYFFVRPFRHLPRKYISKREILDRIYSDYVDKGFARPLWPKEEFMRLTHKNLLAIYTDLCKAYRKWLEYHGAPDEGGYGAGQLDKIPIDKLI